MCLKNLIAMVVTTVAFASSFANASPAEYVANNRAQVLEKSGKKDSVSNKETRKATGTTAKASADIAPVAPGQPADTNANAGVVNTPATPSQPTNINVNSAENGGDGSSATSGGTEYGETYHHNTSIYKDDGSLWRVEYYDDNNRLCEYSDVDNYDKDTHSYTETVYRYDEENDVEIPVRTDTYVNGELVSSVYH